MSEAATDDCEGCDEERPVQQLREVTLPSGHTVVCCPDCRYHAEKLVEGATRVCEGCGSEVGADALEPTPLTDGRKLDLCSDCVAEASTIYETERARGTGGTTTGETGDAAGDTATTSADAVGTDSATDSAGTTTGSDAGASSSTGSARSSSTDASTTAVDEDPGDESLGDDEPAADEESGAGAGRTGKPATTDDVCDQCGELFSIELYKVKTVDGRTEQFCPDCKDEGIEEGIVRDVELRRAQAYEVLELDGGADQSEIRQAYLRRVKEVHPDRADGNRSEFMLVQEAYDRLSEE